MSSDPRAGGRRETEAPEPRLEVGGVSSSAGGILGRLRARGFRPRKSLGQNFLHDPRLLGALVDAASPSRADTVLEVGTGPGTLTRKLAEHAGHVLSVEVDPRLADFARGELSDLDNVEILVGDALQDKSTLSRELESRLRATGPFLWVSNLPYAVAVPLTVAVLESRLPWKVAVLTLQLEVAEKLCARSGDSRYGAVTALVGFWSEARILRKIAAGSFWPRPKVPSAAVVLRPLERPREPALYADYRAWVQTLFRSRRKQLRGLLRARLGSEAAEDALRLGGWHPSARPQELAVDDFQLLAENFPLSV